MIFNENTPNLIRILPGNTGFSQIQGEAGLLSVGQKINLQVLDVLPDGKAIVQLNGQKFSVNHGGQLVKDQTLQAKVEQIEPDLLLKLEFRNESSSTADFQKNSGSTIKPDVITQLTSLKPDPQPTLFQNKDLQSLQFKPGQTIKAVVNQVLNRNTLEARFHDKIFTISISDKQTSYKPGEPINLNIRATAAGYLLETQSQNFRTLDATALKHYVIAKNDLGNLVIGLDKLIQSSVLKEAKIEAELIDRIRRTLDVLISREGTATDGKQLKEQVDRSGINYEAKVKRFLEQKLNSESRAVLSKDLKGQLLELQTKLERVVLGKPAAFTSQAMKALQETVQQVKMAADGIELQQLSNQFSRQEQNPVLLQIPDPYFPESHTAKIYIRPEGEGDDKGQGGKKDFNLVFLLDLSNIGKVRIDAKVLDKQFYAKFGLEEDQAVNFIEMNKYRLQERLNEMGFQTDVTCCIQKEDEMVMEDVLEKLLSENSHRLLDIKT